LSFEETRFDDSPEWRAPWCLYDVARWLGYPDDCEYIDACETQPDAVMARLRRRLQ